MINKRYMIVRLFLIMTTVLLAFGLISSVRGFNSFADETSYPTTALKVVGVNASEDVTWRVLKTTPFKDTYDGFNIQADYENYSLGTKIERTWNNEDGVVPWWSIKLSDLKKYGKISGIAVSKVETIDGNETETIVKGFYASQIDNAFNDVTYLEKEDLGATPYSMGMITLDGISPWSSKSDCYSFSNIAYIKDTNRFIECESLLCLSDYEDEPYAEVYVADPTNDEDLEEAKDPVNNTVVTLFFNGEERKLLFDDDDMKIEVGQTAKRVAKTQSSYYGDAKVTYTSSDESVATVDDTGIVTAVAAGEANITASIKDGDKETSKSYKVVVTKAADPVVDSLVKAINDLPDPDKLTLEDESLVDAAQNAYSDLTEDQKAQVTNYNTLLEARLKIADLKLDKATTDIAELTTAKETVEGELEQAKKEKQEAQDELTAIKDEIAASKLTVSGLKVTSKSKKFTITWKKNAKADGYQVQYRLKGAKKFKTLKTVSKTKVVSKKLKKGKKYQFRVATYRIVNSKKVYGKWSPVKTAKCR